MESPQSETLNRLGEMRAFNRWMFEQFEPFLGARVLEVGCGTGNLTAELLASNRSRVAATDVERPYVGRVRERFEGRAGFSAHPWDLGTAPPREIARTRFDSVLCVNVLEHVRDDIGALVRCRKLLVPGGSLVFLVPAWPVLYAPLDAAIGHFRRYTRATLAAAFSAAGCASVQIRAFNLFGIFGWLWAGKILRRKVLPEGALGFYERMVPLFRLAERMTGPPIGLSWIAVARNAG